ncbi:MAG TPA: NADH-quinone oxidoreductase subunit C [Bacteroidales bacterium]|nr:NADH-quinone oxidoreductase subunit C [Bacteroidales bacterium]
MDQLSLKQHLTALQADLAFPENKQYAEAVVPCEQMHSFCEKLKSDPALQFDYLISLTAVDWKDHFMEVCHLTSTSLEHMLVVKTKIDREKAEADTVSDIWKTAEFQEREVFDLFGIRFRNHPDLRRLFLEDDYGFPLRKDFSDESRMIVR